MTGITRSVRLPAPFSLAATCGPVHWTTGRSPRHAWSGGVLTWVGWEGERAVWRSAHQTDDACLTVEGTGDPDRDKAWAAAVLGSEIHLPRFEDPVMAGLAGSYPGLHPYCDGSVFEGVITAIVGQSISVAAAAVTQAKLCALFGNEVAVNGLGFRPLPRVDQLAEASAELIRSSGVTWKRAEALRYAATEALSGNLPDDEAARDDPDAAVRALMTMPLVGRWTAESVVLWGVGAPNAHPTGDVALLRAAKHAYNRQDLTLKSLDALAKQWLPARGLAARLLWTHLFGPAPERPVV